MNLGNWYQKRGMKFVFQRGLKLLNRYGLTQAKASQRIKSSMSTLALNRASPTFPVPARVLERSPAFFHSLQDMGAEIAVHGYTHTDLKACSPFFASQQLLKAAEIFKREGLAVHGFRCPYLSCSDELIEAIPQGAFKYSSNQAIRWLVPSDFHSYSEVMVNTLDRFYCSKESQVNLCLPWFRKGMVEIPVCVPDDIQLFDGFQMSADSVARYWTEILARVHQRGELFSLVFHPELFYNCIESLAEVLQEARGYSPGFWVAHFYEIADWWLEKSSFTFLVDEDEESLTIRFGCTPRSTILVRRLDQPGTRLDPWMGEYRWLRDQSLTVPPSPRPFLGISPNFPENVRAFLAEEGYLLETGEPARRCAVRLDAELVQHFKNRVELVEWIESQNAPLVRYWPWPEGMRAALSLSGDLDALSIIDYSNRLLNH